MAIDWLRQLPEIRSLQAISEASGIPIRIHGGFARNLLALASKSLDTPWIPSPVFTNLIDPYGDVDLIVPNSADIEPLIRQIQSRIGIAPSLRWEVRTASQIDRARHTGAATALDLVEIGPDRLELKNADAAEDDFRQGVCEGHAARALERSA